MDANIDQLVTDTGVVIPLAARLLQVIKESGASKLELDIALGVVSRLAHLLPVTLVPDYAQAHPSETSRL